MPIASVWNAYFAAIAKHFFVFRAHKGAVVYWYDTETCKFIGPLFDRGSKFDEEKCKKLYSVINKQATVNKSTTQEIEEEFTKTTNLHQFPILPLNVLHSRRTHDIK